MKPKFNLPNRIKTLSSTSKFKTKVKGSIFIGISNQIDSVENAVSFLESIKKKYYDATHHCYSYKLADNSFKYSDDGEPSGTAGVRIFNAQNHFELTNLITVIVRYFGGTKLGTGPLGKAYYETAFSVLDSSEYEFQNLYKEIIIEYDYKDSQAIHSMISNYKLLNPKYLHDPIPRFTCLIEVSKIQQFESELADKRSIKIISPYESMIYLSQKEC